MCHDWHAVSQVSFRNIPGRASDRGMMRALAGVNTEIGVDGDFDFFNLIVDFSTAIAVSTVSDLLSPVATAIAMTGMAL